MASGLLRDLLRRRVPQILGIYLAVGWGVLEFMDWLIGRYGLPERLADLSLLAWAAMIPTVLLIGYCHGERGDQPWTGTQKIGVTANVVAALVLMVIVLSSRGVMAGGRINAAALDPTRIAVLYFDDESEGQDLGHLASAFTGALIDELTQVRALDVIPRGAVKPYRDVSVSLDSLVRALQMGTLVEGSVSGSKERLTLNVALIEPASQSTIESFVLDGSVEEWRDLREDLATRVARFLRQSLGIETRLRERRAGTESEEALTLFEQAERLYEEFERYGAAGDTAAAVRELAHADSLLAAAESLDPNWLAPIVQRGWWSIDLANLGRLGPGAFDRSAMETALAHAERALDIAPDYPTALELRGMVRFEMSEDRALADPSVLRDSARQDLHAAVTADPFRARAWATLSELQRVNSRPLEAKHSAERALEADPFLSDARLIVFRLYQSSLDLEDIDEAVYWCAEHRRRFADHEASAACYLFLLALSRGPAPDIAHAWALLDTLQELGAPQLREQHRLVGQTWLAAALARVGAVDSAASVIRRTRAEATGGLVPWIDYYGANVWLLQGDREAALEWLASFLEAIPQRKGYVASDWMFRELWSDPRFQALVATEG